MTTTDSFIVPGTFTFVVPAGVTSLNLVAFGAQGGQGGTSPQGGTGPAGGLGAEESATISVTPGQVLTVTVGGRGQVGSNSDGLTPGLGGAGGSFGGGGNGGAGGINTTLVLGASAGAGGGGGQSSVFNSGTPLVIAGGGGGGGSSNGFVIGGGSGGGLTGQPVTSSFINNGLGGTQISGGVAGANIFTAPGGTPPTAGTSGVGGVGASGGTSIVVGDAKQGGGGGGGGGLFGGGGGGVQGNGGGGSGFGTFVGLSVLADGKVTITYILPPPPPSPVVPMPIQAPNSVLILQLDSINIFSRSKSSKSLLEYNLSLTNVGEVLVTNAIVLFSIFDQFNQFSRRNSFTFQILPSLSSTSHEVQELSLTAPFAYPVVVAWKEQIFGKIVVPILLPGETLNFRLKIKVKADKADNIVKFIAAVVADQELSTSSVREVAAVSQI